MFVDRNVRRHLRTAACAVVVVSWAAEGGALSPAYWFATAKYVEGSAELEPGENARIDVAVERLRVLTDDYSRCLVEEPVVFVAVNEGVGRTATQRTPLARARAEAFKRSLAQRGLPTSLNWPVYLEEKWKEAGLTNDPVTIYVDAKVNPYRMPSCYVLRR